MKLTDDCLIAIKLILNSFRENTPKDKKRNALLVIFDVTFTNATTDDTNSSHDKLFQVMYEKAKEALQYDTRFEEYVSKFEDIIEKNNDNKHLDEVSDALVTLMDDEKLKKLEAKKAIRLKRELARLA